MVTWKDYTGPAPGGMHRQAKVIVPLPASYLTASSAGGSACCREEIEERKKWAIEQDAQLRTIPLGNGLSADVKVVRTFDTGANRDKDDGKLDFEGFLSPLVLGAFATYMNFNRSLADGTTRASDNWQKGIPKEVYAKSGWRHFFAFWSIHRGWGAKETMVWAICGVLFNLSGYLHELLKDNPKLLEQSLAEETKARDALRKAS